METARTMAGAEQAQKRSRAGRFMPGHSGNPKGGALDRVAERAAELFAAMAPEFGELSAVDRALLQQAALLLSRSERLKRPKDADAAVRMSSEARRLVAALRKAAKTARRGPTLAEYLATKAAGAEA